MPFVNAKNEKIDTAIECDICIIGAGAAGITLAKAFAGASHTVTLVESGDFALDGETQSLYTGKNLGLPYYDLASCRLRYFGGTTNHWAGYCRPNDPIDYEGRPDLGVPAWPVKGAEIEPYLSMAAERLGLSPEGFDPVAQAQMLGAKREDLLDAELAGVVTKVYQIATRLRFRQIYRDELKAAPNLTVLLNCNITRLNLAPGGQAVQEATFAVLSGDTGTIRARIFILACHAIENARILLSSDDVMPDGVGNQHGHVGRYFMEHPAITSGLFVANPSRFSWIYDARADLAKHVNVNLALSARTMKEEGILQYYCRFQRVQHELDVKRAMGRLKDDFWEPFEVGMLDDIATILSDLDETGAVVKEKLLGERSRPMRFRLDQRIEQAPNPESRVVLSNETDGLGMRKADLIWRLNEIDYRSFQKGQETIVRELSAAGIGRFVVEELTEEHINEHVSGRNHHMGTTRMAADESNGVVDPDCRVFGIDNLYIAGSSIFPTAGYGGPTMLLIAFALRLAEHIKTRVRV